MTIFEHIDIYSILGLFALGQSIFLLIFILIKKWNDQSFRILFFIIIVLMFEVFHDFTVRTRLILEIPDLLSTAHAFSYAIGPLIYFYILSLTRKKRRFKWYDLLHFIPFIIYNISKLSSYLEPRVEKISFLNYYYQSLDEDPLYFFVDRGFLDILYGFLKFDIHKLIYIIATFYVYNLYKKKVYNQYSNLNKTNLVWMNVVLYGYLVIWLLIPLQRFSGFIINDVHLMNNFGYLLLPIHLYFIAYIVFTYHASPDMPEISKEKPRVDQKHLDQVLNEVTSYMITHKLYLDPNLTLTMLSEKVNIRLHDISQSINHIKAVSFYDYINAFRIDEAKVLLKDENQNQFTIEYIGTQSGFSSKATFYRAFKKNVGLTPTQYQNQ